MSRRSPLLLATLAVTVGLGLSLAGPVSASAPGELAPGAHPAPDVHASDQVVYHYDRSESAARAAKPPRPGSSPNMTNHGGRVLSSATTTGTVFWGPSWAATNTAFVQDKIAGLDRWYGGFSDSNYAKTTSEYADVNGALVSTSSTYAGHVVDLSPASGGASSGAILAEVGRAITNPVANGYYAVYTDLPRGRAKYCAWHSAGTVGTTPVEFAFFWKLDGDPGCDPGNTVTSHSQGLAALANVSGHELAEAMTDPATPGAWYDSAGSENGDKCAWTFNVPAVSLGGESWTIQGEWSNKAYTAGTGYANSSGQKGCVSGA
ncbi:MAG: hypothetical protein JWP11_2304 [Frankiales bacterium]|jgi:hypothetical protein|nr:hypothetical protein [Frankiales bacterium]